MEVAVVEKSFHNCLQISNMINRHNRWRKVFSPKELMYNKATYIAIMYEKVIIACAGVYRESPTVSKIQHVCVLPEFRRMGAAVSMVNYITNLCHTDYVYMTIRCDNTSSILMALRTGFIYHGRTWSTDHWTLTFVRDIRRNI